MKQPPDTVEVTIHVHNGHLITACPDPCIVKRGGRIVWKACDPKDKHFLSIENFREKATGAAHNPTTQAGYDVAPGASANANVDHAADETTYTYTVKMIERPTLIAHANAYVKKLALVGEPALTHADVEAITSAMREPAQLAPHLVQLFGSEDNFLGFARMMMCSYSDQELNPDIQVGGTGN